MTAGFDILIVGGGMVGLSLAARLNRSPAGDDLRITVVDAAARPRFDTDDDVGLRVSALSAGSIAMLGELDAWSDVCGARSGPFTAMRVWDAGSDHDAADALRFDAADYGVPTLGHIVENALIRDALIASLADSRVDLRFGTAIDAIVARRSADGYDVRLKDGERLSPQLLVGADGSTSRVRKGAGIAVRAWQYPQSAFVTHVASDKPHRDTAWQRFLSDGPLALLPLADGRASVVWSTSPERVEEALAADDALLGEMLTEASDRVLGDLRVSGPRGSFPLRAQHAVAYVDTGLALIGDAAHSVHPLAGQGANLGLADVRSLAAAIDRALALSEYPGDLPTLRRYERERRGANAAMLHFIDSINRLFLADRGFFAHARRRGMQLFNRSGPVRRKAVEVALGMRL